MAELTRASVFAVKEETTAGTLIVPVAADFIPLKSGSFSIDPSFEELTNEELKNSIGLSKPKLGKETPTGTHGVYLKHSEVEGTAPEYAPMLKSCFGTQTDYGTEYDTVAGSTTTVINVDSGEGANYAVGQALHVKDATNGFSIRNVKSISSDALTVNFALDNAPASGVDLGKANLFSPAETGHISFSSWMYRGNAGAVEAIAGCRTSGFTINGTAGEQLEAEFTYDGTTYYFDPLTVTSANKYMDVTDDGGTFVVTMTEKTYRSPEELADEIQTKGQAGATASGGDDFLCTYSSTTGKFTISTTTGAVLSILWKTGTHGADNADDHIGDLIGFSDAADDTGATSYVSDSALSWAASVTPSYDDADNLVVKGAELLIGDATDNVCRKAQTFSVAMTTPTSDVDSICAASGVSEKLILNREIELSATLVLERHEVGLFDKFLNNTSTQAMLNVFTKSGDNSVAGKNVNAYLANATITGHTVTGDEIVTLDITMKSFITNDLKDYYLNFV